MKNEKNEPSRLSACAALPRTAGGSKQSGAISFGRKKGQLPSKHRHPAMRQVSEKRFAAFPFAGRSPDSSVQGQGSSSGPGPLAFPFAGVRTVACVAARADLPLRGQCRDGSRAKDPRAHRLPVSPDAPGNARRTPATRIISTPASGPAHRRTDIIPALPVLHETRHPAVSRAGVSVRLAAR
jgi:hypothetical protein